MSTWSEAKKEEVWEKDNPVKGKNPNLYRRGPEGNMICKPLYGRDAPMAGGGHRLTGGATTGQQGHSNRKDYVCY